MAMSGPRPPVRRTDDPPTGMGCIVYVRDIAQGGHVRMGSVANDGNTAFDPPTNVKMPVWKWDKGNIAANSERCAGLRTRIGSAEIARWADGEKGAGGEGRAVKCNWGHGWRSKCPQVMNSLIVRCNLLVWSRAGKVVDPPRECKAALAARAYCSLARN
jgi:hypothetical protein